MKAILISLIICYTFYNTTAIKSTKPQTDPLKESILRGQEIYTDFCMSCHMPDGKGVEKTPLTLLNDN